MNSAHFIKETRKKLELTQIELAKLIWPEKSVSTGQTKISKYESGNTTPSGDTILKLLELQNRTSG